MEIAGLRLTIFILCSFLPSKAGKGEANA